MKKIAFLLAALALLRTATAQTPMHNGDFETWTTDTRTEPIGWKTDNIYSTTSPSTVFVTRVAGTTNFGIRLETIFANGFPYAGYFSNGTYYNGQGGATYSSASTPTSLNGMWRYGLQPNDSAEIDLVFKKSGAVIGRDTFFIKGSLSSFTGFSLPISALTVTPDSFILSAYSGIFGNGGKVGSFLELDELQFGTSAGIYPMPNGSFNWNSIAVVYADGWYTTGNAEQTFDKHAGNYAMKLTTKDNGKGLESGTLRSKLISINTTKTDTLTGWYKYIPSGSDQAAINLTLYDVVNTNEELLSGIFPPRSTYVFFAIPLTNTISAGAVDFVISSSNGTPINGSTFFVDNLAINGRPVAAGAQTLLAYDRFLVYPNPARDVLYVRSPLVTGALSVTVRDITGREVLVTKSTVGTGAEVSLGLLSPGVYYYEVRQEDAVGWGRIMKE